MPRLNKTSLQPLQRAVSGRYNVWSRSAGAGAARVVAPDSTEGGRAVVDRPYCSLGPTTSLRPPLLPKYNTGKNAMVLPMKTTTTPSSSMPPPLSSRSLTSHFSTAAMPQTAAASATDNPPRTTKKKRRAVRKRIDPLIITPTAAARIQFLIDQHNAGGIHHAVGIRLGTKKRGCNGLSYTLNYAYDNHAQEHGRDEAMTISLEDPSLPGDGLKVYVEPMALMNVIGTTMDFVDDEMSSEFTFTNPNSKGECGCGESFNV